MKVEIPLTTEDKENKVAYGKRDVIHIKHLERDEHFFTTWDEVRAIWDEIPDTFGVDDLKSKLKSHGRNVDNAHLLIRYYLSHPNFKCKIAKSEPIKVAKIYNYGISKEVVSELGVEKEVIGGYEQEEV